MKLPLDVLKIVTNTVCLFCFLNSSVFQPRVTNALQFDGAYPIYESEINNKLSIAASLLQPFTSLCIISGNKEFLDVFIKYHKSERKIYTFLEPGNTSVYNCESVVMLDVTPQPSEKIDDKKFKCAFYSLHYFTPLTLSSLTNCFVNSSSSEVVVMSLKDNLLFELSPIFPFPRFFIKSSVKEVIGHRSNRNVDNFGGIAVTGAFMIYPPFVLVKHNKGMPDEVDGIEVLLFKELSQKLNFTLKYLFYKSWGRDSPNGTWLEGVGWAMQEGLAQVAVCGLWQLYAFDPLVDFGPSLAMEEIISLVRRPEQIDFSWKDVMKTFKIIVWFSVLSSFALITALYWFGIIRVLPAYKGDWTCSALTVFGHFTMSSSHTYFSDYFTRLILTSWSVFSLLLTTVLSTGIVSSLTLPSYSPRIDTVQQMVEGGYYWTGQFYADFQSDDMKASIFDFTNNWHILFEKKYKYMTKNEVKVALYSDMKITFSSQVFNDDSIVLDTDGLLGEDGLKKFRVAREPLNKGHVSFGVEKHSSLFEPLLKTTLRFVEAGLLKKWKMEVVHRWPQYDSRHLLVETDVITFSQPEVMHIAKLRPLFYLLLAGLALASLVFSIEILWHYS